MTIANHDVFMSDSLSDLISYEKNEDNKKLGKFEVMIEFHGQKMFFDIVEFEENVLCIVVPSNTLYTISSIYDFDHILQFDVGQGALSSFTETYKTTRILKAKKNANATWNVTIEFGAAHE